MKRGPHWHHILGENRENDEVATLKWRCKLREKEENEQINQAGFPLSGVQHDHVNSEFQ